MLPFSLLYCCGVCGAGGAGVVRADLRNSLQRSISARINRASSGMIQQIALARALLGDPALVLLDEPTRSLDADARGRLWQALERRPQTSLVIATHLEEDVNRCDGRVDFPT